MATAGTMIAHQVAAKALRDAAFLTAWPATALPLMTLATAAATVALVPTFSRVLDRFSPVAVVAGGFALSAAAHAAEWAFFDAGRWVAIVINLHLAAVGAILLSGLLVADRRAVRPGWRTRGLRPYHRLGNGGRDRQQRDRPIASRRRRVPRRFSRC